METSSAPFSVVSAVDEDSHLEAWAFKGGDEGRHGTSPLGFCSQGSQTRVRGLKHVFYLLGGARKQICTSDQPPASQPLMNSVRVIF